MELGHLNETGGKNSTDLLAEAVPSDLADEALKVFSEAQKIFVGYKCCHFTHLVTTLIQPGTQQHA